MCNTAWQEDVEQVRRLGQLVLVASVKIDLRRFRVVQQWHSERSGASRMSMSSQQCSRVVAF